MEKNYDFDITANYHTHTTRCGHACGEDREYVEEAIKAGFKIMGFSEHTFYPTGFKSGMRMDLNDADGYFASIESLRKEYKNDIDIYAGLETEYFPEYFDKLLDFCKDYPVEYMILGQHFVPDEQHGIYLGCDFTDRAYLDLYVEDVIKGIQSGKFMYVAHPDLPKYIGVYEDELLNEAFEKICKAAKEYNVPLEINMLGLNRKIQYPSDRFFSIAGKYDNDVIIGMDVHNPKHYHNQEALEKCIQLAKKYNLNLLRKIDIEHK